MKHLITIFLFLLITSCKKKQYQVESKFANGNNEIIYHSLNDTIIYGKTFSKKLRIKFNQKKDTLRKGIYINELALGEHLFYEKNVINCKRKYVIPNPYFIDLDIKNDEIDFKNFKIRSDSTYLNTGIFFDKNGDSVLSKSHFYKTKFFRQKWKVNDTLKVEFEFYFPGYEVIKSNLYFMVPEDTSMITMGLNADKNFTLNRRILNKKHNHIEGVVEILAYDKNKPIKDLKSYAERIIFINEKIIIE
jgi:hypothetical protein|tara:strand:+ start:72 stop:812 length:741 start_codon:yes stop_codon:yes gene_type:complete